MQMVLVMRQLTAVLEHLIFQATRESQLTPQDALVLGWLAQQPGISGSEIAWSTGRSRQSVQRALERFERRQLVERYQSAFAERTVGWALTEPGRVLWLALERRLGSHEKELQAKGIKIAPFVDGLRRLMDELMTAERAMSISRLVEPPRPTKTPEWDL